MTTEGLVQIETKSNAAWYDVTSLGDSPRLIRQQLAIDMAEATSPNWRTGTLDESATEVAGKDLRSD